MMILRDDRFRGGLGRELGNLYSGYDGQSLKEVSCYVVEGWCHFHGLTGETPIYRLWVTYGANKLEEAKGTRVSAMEACGRDTK